MKKLIVFAMVAAALTIFNGCQKDEPGVSQLADEVQPQEVVQPDVYVENGYLAFKSKEIFDSIRSEVEKFNQKDFHAWENSLNFISARTEKYFAEEEALKIKNDEEAQNFREKFNQQFNINDDLDIRYKFYSSGLEDVLNIDGVVKIGNSLYKFTHNKEFIILDGDHTKLTEINKELKSGTIENENIVIFYPFPKQDNLKSTEILDQGIKTVGIRRLVWSVEKYVFSSIVNFDPYTGQTNYTAGYELNLVMNQEKYRGLFNKKWRNNEASYNLEDQYIDWNETGVAPTPGYTGWFQDDYIGTTRNTVKVHYISKSYLATQPIYKDFALRDFKVTFWSSGITESNKISVDL